MHKSCLFLLVALVSLSAGCGETFEAVPLVPVSGKITSAKPFDKKGLGVTFVSAKGSATGNAVVAEDGTFKGEAPVGDNVAFFYGAPVSGPAGAGHADASKTKTNNAFWNASTSPWKVTVAAEGKKDIDLSLDTPIVNDAASGHKAR